LQNEAGYAKPRLQLHESLRSFCIGCGSMVPNLDGQRRPPCKQHSKLSNSRRPRRDPRSLPGRWRWCDRPWLCDAQKASALHTLIRQRHPTPSCGGHAPTAERTTIPARMCLESLDRRPGIRGQPGSKAIMPKEGLPVYADQCTLAIGQVGPFSARSCQNELRGVVRGRSVFWPSRHRACR
jgi:hypothetical protein